MRTLLTLLLLLVPVGAAHAEPKFQAVSLGSTHSNPSHVGTAGGGRVQARCRTVTCLTRALAWHKHNERHLEAELQMHRATDLRASIEIASILFGVPARDMTCIAWAESGYGRQTTSEAGSGALGPFQWLASSWATTPLGRAGYSRLDPLAASLATAQRVVQDGGWHEWVTGPGCGL